MADLKTRVATGMPTKNRPQNIGKTLADQASRIDGVAKVTGRARFSHDRYLPGGLFAAFIRCPWGKASLRSADQKAAQAVDGVLEVEITGRDGKHHGHNIGYILADSKAALRRGFKALDAQWRMDRPDTCIEDAMKAEPKTPGAIRKLLSRCDHTLEAVYQTPVVTHSSLETHGCVVDHRDDSATIYASTQGTQAATDGVSGVIDLPKSSLTVVCEYVGGGFGSKLNGAGKEGALAARLSAKHRKPVYVFTDRAEEHLDTGNRPSSRALVRIGFDKDGTVRGGQILTWGGVGVAAGGGGTRIPSGRYNLGDIKSKHENVRFNGGAPRPFRAPGSPQGAFAEELMLDEIASACGIDPLTLRLRHDVNDERKQMLKLGAEKIGWRHRQPNGSQTGAVRRGFGCGTTSWPRFPARAEAEVVINRDGSVEARTGTQDIGTGQRTIMATVVSEYLGAPMESIGVAIGRSNLPPGPGSGGSMTAPNTSPAMMGAAADAKDKFLTHIADMLGGNAGEFDLVDGEILRNSKPLMPFAKACSRLPVDQVIGRGALNRSEGREYIKEGHSHGAQFVDLDVDIETGVVSVKRVVAIQSCGVVLCRKTAESQIMGGVIQGLSYALFENKILDRNTGAMVNPNLEAYKILGSTDMPHIEPVLWTRGQTGVRSLGEPPIIPTAGAVACAVFNAVGAPVRSLPITPDRVLDAVERSRA